MAREAPGAEVPDRQSQVVAMGADQGGPPDQLVAPAFGQTGFDAHNLAGGIMAWVDLENALEPEDGTVAEPRPV